MLGDVYRIRTALGFQFEMKSESKCNVYTLCNKRRFYTLDSLMTK